MKGFSRLIAIGAAFVLGLTACTRTEAPSAAAVATKFVAGINRGDVATIVALCAEPLHVRQHDWESARDGAGFVLGKSRDISLRDSSQIERFFADPSNRIAVQAEIPDPVTASLLIDELRGQESMWRGLSIQLFRRGIGDVEHIFAVGINDRSKVAAIYMN